MTRLLIFPVLAVAFILLSGCAVGVARDGSTVVGLKPMGQGDVTQEQVNDFASAAGGVVSTFAPGFGGLVEKGIIAGAGLLGVGAVGAAARKRGKQADEKQAEADEAWDSEREQAIQRAKLEAEVEISRRLLTRNVQEVVAGGA